MVGKYTKLVNLINKLEPSSLGEQLIPVLNNKVKQAWRLLDIFIYSIHTMILLVLIKTLVVRYTKLVNLINRQMHRRVAFFAWLNTLIPFAEQLVNLASRWWKNRTGNRWNRKQRGLYFQPAHLINYTVPSEVHPFFGKTMHHRGERLRERSSWYWSGEGKSCLVVAAFLPREHWMIYRWPGLLAVV